MEPHFNGAHTQTLDSFCVYFSFVFCPIWKAFTITISFPASSLPHHFALLGFAFTTRPSNYVVYLLTHKFLPFLYYYFFLQRQRCLCLLFSLLSLVSPGYRLLAVRSHPPPFQSRMRLFYYLFSFCCTSNIPVFCIQKGKQSVASSIVSARCIFHDAIFLKYFFLFFSLSSSSREQVDNNSYCAACVRNIAQR